MHFSQNGGALSRRNFVLTMAAVLGYGGPAAALECPVERPSGPFRLSEPLPDFVDQVAPKAGVPTGVVFADSLHKAVVAGVLDAEKLRAADKELPKWVERALAAPSDEPILFNAEAAPYLVDLLWPLGLANRASFNEKSPIFTPRIPGFASTGGWTLGREPSGYVYFNRVDAIRMTNEQQATVLEIATSSFRPCCDNSTLFQDCNHGSALLGLLELAASQGATAEGLFGLALTANSFWFPDYYAATALYFWHFHHRPWDALAPKLILAAEFSSLSGWQKNVNARLLQANIGLPSASKGQQAC